MARVVGSGGLGSRGSGWRGVLARAASLLLLICLGTCHRAGFANPEVQNPKVVESGGPGPAHGIRSLEDVQAMSARSPGSGLLSGHLSGHLSGPGSGFAPGEVSLDPWSGDPEALVAWHGALTRAKRGEGKARMMVFGASHVASDWITNRFRMVLQKAYGDGGPGWVLPVRPWRSYRHRIANVQGSAGDWTVRRIRAHAHRRDAYGVAGVAFDSESKGAFGSVATARVHPLGRTVGRFEVHYYGQPRGGSFGLEVDGTPVSEVNTRVRVAAANVAVVAVEDGAHRLDVKLKGNGPVRLFGVVMERDVPGVVVDTLGVNGARAQYSLLWDEAVFAFQMRQRAPDLVVIAYGTNESGDDDVPMETYRSKLVNVVQRFRQAAPQATCVLMGPSDRPFRSEDGEGDFALEPRERTEEIVAVQREVSAQQGCAFFDLFGFMGGHLSMDQWVAEGLGAPDFIHFTRRGYERVADAMLLKLDLPQ